MMQSLPTVKLGGYDISRLVIGGNPFSGHSHISPEMDAAMEDYFTAQRIKETLFRCLEYGINTCQLRADRHIARVLREFKADGGAIHWVAQTASEYLLEADIGLMKKYQKPIAVYHHGTITDNLIAAGNIAELRRRLDMLRALDIPVGLGTHIPAVIERAEEERWGVDFYMACLYNLSKVERQSSAVTGRFNNGEPFDEPDRALMLKTVAAVNKPFLVFKLLGAGRRCLTPEDVTAAFTEAYTAMKPTDAAVVGMFPRDSDQIKQNTEIVRRLLAE